VNPKIFPTILMLLDLCAAVVWLTHGDWRKALYWTCAAVLTFTVTY
jgi:hypothetical protein